MRLIFAVNVVNIANNGVLSHSSLSRIRVTFLLILMVLSFTISAILFVLKKTMYKQKNAYSISISSSFQ